MKKTIKQIRNLKDYMSDNFTWIWTAQLINGNWDYDWYNVGDIISNNFQNHMGKITDKFEFYFDNPQTDEYKLGL